MIEGAMKHYDDENHDAPLNRFLGDSGEGWQRSVTLLCYLRTFWNRASMHYGPKRKQVFFLSGLLLKAGRTTSEYTGKERRDDENENVRCASEVCG